MYRINRPAVMVSGSRSLSQLPEEAVVSLEKIADQGMRVLVGDAPGIDYEVQKYLASIGYPNVTIHHIGSGNPPGSPRNIVDVFGDNTQIVPGSYSNRDAYMARLADYGLAIWDGRSRGTRRNIDRVPKTKVITVPGRIANIRLI